MSVKILGLSQPSCKAHLEKIKLKVSKLSNFSFSLKIKSIVSWLFFHRFEKYKFVHRPEK